jgi:hypothetical protein
MTARLGDGTAPHDFYGIFYRMLRHEAPGAVIGRNA